MTDLAFSGVHHISLPVTDLAVSIGWYERCLAAQRVRRFDHHDEAGAVFAVVLQLPGRGPMVEPRRDVAVASAVSGFMPVAFAVRDQKELSHWIDHLKAQHICAFPGNQAACRGIGRRDVSRRAGASLLHRSRWRVHRRQLRRVRL